MKKKLVEGKLFYGWYIVIAGFLIMAVAWGAVYNCSSLFIIPISEELSFTRSEINLTMTIRSACQVIMSLISGKIFMRYNIKRLMQVATVALLVSFFAHSFASSLIMFYILTAIAAISLSLISVLPLAIILNNWFNENRGVAIGIAFMGSGVGGMILGALVGQWIVAYGWRMAYIILGVIMLIFTVPSVFYIIHIRPNDLGLEPLGGYGENSINGVEEDGITLAQARKTIVFWGIIICTIFISLGVNSLMMTVAPHLTDIGYSSIFSANIVALSMGSLAIGKLALGKLFDKFGVHIASTASCLATLLGLLGLIFAKSYLGLAAIILGAGLGSAYGTIANPIITSSLFGRKDYGTINGVLQSASGMGGVVGPILTGYLYDQRGSYSYAYIIMAVITVGVIIAYQFVLPKRKAESEGGY